MNSIYLSF